MSRTHCADCGHKYTLEGNDNPHADGGHLEVSHGGGVCRSCYLKHGGHKECGECGQLAYNTMKFCYECGKKFDQS